jgi:hypothetical protein
MDELFTTQVRDRFATNRLGAFAVSKVFLRAQETGMHVFIPLWEGRCDLVLDDGLKLYRVQVKYAGQASPKKAQGVVPLSLRKCRNDGRAVIPYYTASEIDLLLVYVRKIDKILWFGPEVFDRRKNLHIRLEPTRNNQKKGCLMARDYIW